MTTRTRTAESKGDAAPAEPPAEMAEAVADAQAEQARLRDEAQQPTDGERALTEIERMRAEIRDSIGTVRANGDRHVELCKRLDTLAEQISGIGQSDMPATADLSEMHDRFDLLSTEVGEVMGALGRADATPGPLDHDRAPVPMVLGQVLDVMRKVTEIGKGGKAPDKMGGYAFRKIDDAIDAIGAAVREVGLVLRSEVADVHTFPRKVGSNPDAWGCRVTMRYVFVSPQDGSEHAIEGVGEGADAGDKATSKAASMALKYALLQGLMIPVVGAHLDSEADDTRSVPGGRQGGRQQQRGGSAYDRATEAQRDAYHRGEQMPDAASSGQPQDGPDPSQDPPEVRAREVMRRANDGRPVDKLQVLLGKAADAGLANVEIEWFGHTDTLQQHMLAAIRLARGQQ